MANGELVGHSARRKLDPQDGGRVRTAMVCLTLCGVASGAVFGGANREAMTSNLVLVSVLVNAAATLGLLAYITWSTRGAVQDLKRAIIAAVRAAIQDELKAHTETITQLVAEVARLRQQARGRSFGARGADDPDTVRFANGAPVGRVVATAPVGGRDSGLAEQVASLGRQLDELTANVPRWIEGARERGRAEGYVKGVRHRLERKRGDGEQSA